MDNNARKYNRYNEVDERILALFAENKEKAFRLLYDTYYLPLCLYSVQFTGSAETSEDIVQNLFVSFWDKNSHTTISSNLHAWLFNAVMHGGSHGNQQERSAYPEEDGTGSVSVLRPDVLHELQEGNMQQEDGIGQEAGPVGQMDEHRWNFNSRRLRGFCK